LIFHEADETIAYNWFTYVPSNMSKAEPCYILITGINAIRTDDYVLMTEQHRITARDRVSLADKNGFILLVPVLPRPETNHVYTQALKREVFFPSTDPFCQRPDDKVNLMIDKLISDLRQDGYNVSEKVFIEGFSAGGMFAQRYAILHPERVQAIAAGAPGGLLTLPESFYEGVELNWPAGVNDLSSLAGYEFIRDTYLQVPQFIFIGSQDTNTILPPGGPDSIFRDSGVSYSFLINAFGDLGVVMIENQVRFLNSIGYDNIAFKMYPGIDHAYTEDMINDVLRFFDTHR
jgi:dienelactone hydrolase